MVFFFRFTIRLPYWKTSKRLVSSNVALLIGINSTKATMKWGNFYETFGWWQPKGSRSSNRENFTSISTKSIKAFGLNLGGCIMSGTGPKLLKLYLHIIQYDCCSSRLEKVEGLIWETKNKQKKKTILRPKHYWMVNVSFVLSLFAFYVKPEPRQRATGLLRQTMYQKQTKSFPTRLRITPVD